jgi:isocitrate/methylisocitrate lyase
MMDVYDSEDQKYWEDVRAVKEWWQGSRWRYTKRPFTAEQIVAKRGNLKIEYPSNTQSQKLWEILEEKFNVRRPVYPNPQRADDCSTL